MSNRKAALVVVFVVIVVGIIYTITRLPRPYNQFEKNLLEEGRQSGLLQYDTIVSSSCKVQRDGKMYSLATGLGSYNASVHIEPNLELVEIRVVVNDIYLWWDIDAHTQLICNS